MGGGLMQLVAIGAMDVYLTGKPQITFFKTVFKRHTNFSIEPIEQSWLSTSDFGRSVNCIMNRVGDLITKMHVVVSLPAVDASTIPWGYVNKLGHAIIANATVEIGGQLIDEQYGDWLNIWYELTHKTGMEPSYANMIGNIPSLYAINTLAKPAYNLYVPLQFWFNRHNGLALPIIALQYHDIKITIQLNSWNNIINYTGSTAPVAPILTNSFLLTDYVYLDSDERKKFIQASHEYLIEQLQFYGAETLTGPYNKYRLNFNHPCKYLIWCSHLERYNSRTLWLSHANLTNGDWVLASNLFAKLMVIACAVPTTTTTIQPVVSSTSIILPISYLATGTTVVQGDIIQLNIKPTGSITQTMLNSVNVMWIVDTIIYDDTGNPQQVVIELANGIVVSNNLTIINISQPISILSSGTMTTLAQSVFNTYGVSIINQLNYANMIDGTDNPVYMGKITLNGHDRFQPLDGYYFNYVQSYQHFSNTPADGINIYSFALRPEEHQPTGTCNFSRIDNATLEINLGLNNSVTENLIYEPYIGTNYLSFLNIYTTNYNVLRIISGMAGLAYNT